MAAPAFWWLVASLSRQRCGSIQGRSWMKGIGTGFPPKCFGFPISIIPSMTHTHSFICQSVQSYQIVSLKSTLHFPCKIIYTEITIKPEISLIKTCWFIQLLFRHTTSWPPLTSNFFSLFTTTQHVVFALSMWYEDLENSASYSSHANSVVS